MRKRFMGVIAGTAVVAVAGLAAAAALAGGSGKVTTIAIAAPAKANDYGWNQMGVMAAKAVGAATGAKVIVNDGIGYDNTEAVLRRLAQSGAKFVIAQASGFNTVAPRIAQQYKVPMISYDNPKNLIKGLYSDIETSSQDGAYLAGILAAKMTKTGTVGIVISAADTNWFKQAGGFAAGARSVNPSVKFLFAQVGQAAYDDAAGGKRVAQSVINGGADVVFGMGDGASFGYLQAAETATKKVWFIDVIGDKTPIDKKGVLLSSVLWDFTQVFKQAVSDINAGTFGTKFYTLGVKNGVSLLKTKYISASVWTEIKKAQAGIADGSVKVPLTPTKAAVDKLLK
jgi:basic membrane protein A